ncbi:MAG: hybrid sensor histidine kinase/response regulator [Candidatus Binatia bacterium]
MATHPSQDDPPTVLPSDSLVPLEAILCSEELNRRPARQPDYETENRALAALVQALADSPRTILQTLADTILKVFKADSAGISLLSKDEKRFYWAAIAGAWQPHLGGGTPRNFGPCGDVLDRNTPLLFRHWEQRYPYLLAATPLAEEGLLVPFHVQGKAVGTIWAIAHDDRRKFDGEDLRQLESLGRFASVAYQAVAFLNTVEQQSEALRQSAQRVGEVQKAQDSRRAALNLMEDAVQSRQSMEMLNAELRESERRFREMIDALPVAIYTTDAVGRLTHFNPVASEFSGRVPELGTDQWCVSWKLYHADGTPMPHAECPMAMALKEGRAIRGVEVIIERPDGTRLWFAPYPTPLRDAEGKIVGGINMLVDITERKLAEEWLEKIVAERTGDLRQANAALLRDMEERKKLEEQLLQAQKMESIGTLAGGIAHDFNNILNIIQGYASLLGKRSSEKSQLAESVEAINETVQRGAGIVRQLLTLARKTEARMEPANVNGIIIGLTKLLKETFPKTIELTLDLNDLPFVIIDPSHINQMLLNLCLNARDAMPEGGKLLLKTEVVSRTQPGQRFREAQQERYVRIRISDTGTGMDAETRRRIFEPFFTTKEHGQGTGLGLSMSYGIINNHAGFVDVTSEVSQGTTFDIYLPLTENEVELIDIKRQPDGERKGNRPGASATVLFVDDEINQLRLMQNFLEGEGYKVLAAKDGAEAVDLHLRHKDEIAAVVLDLRLPKLNGWEAFQIMKKTQPNLNALFATGLPSPEVEAELAKEEMGGLIMKPYQLHEVLEKISEILQKPTPSITEIDLLPKSSQP